MAFPHVCPFRMAAYDSPVKLTDDLRYGPGIEEIPESLRCVGEQCPLYVLREEDKARGVYKHARCALEHLADLARQQS